MRVRDLWERSKDYRRTFDPPHARRVLADLEGFCFAAETTHVVGDRDSSLIAEGRRQVYLRMVKMARLTPAEIESFTTEIEE